jgi:hypothetical protein
MTVVGRTALFANKIDQTTSGKAQLEYEHKQVHSGDAWMVTYNFLTTEEINHVDRYIITPNTTRWAHLLWDVASQGKCTIYLYEGAVGTYNAVTAYNRNRNSARVNTTIIGDPLVPVSSGTLIWSWQSGTTGTASGRSSGASRETGEIVLKQNTQYLFSVIASTEDIILSVDLTWYEQTNIEN